MALIVEDGTGLPTSNSYATVAQANAYFLDRGVLTWEDADDEDKAFCLIRATDYIDMSYIFLSVPENDDQALENPRYGQDGLKPVLVKATMELALIMLSVPFTTTAADAQTITTVEQGMHQVGFQKTEYSQLTNDPYPEITRRLKSIASPRGVSGGGGTVWMTK